MWNDDMQQGDDTSNPIPQGDSDGQNMGDNPMSAGDAPQAPAA